MYGCVAGGFVLLCGSTHNYLHDLEFGYMEAHKIAIALCQDDDAYHKDVFRFSLTGWCKWPETLVCSCPER